jgi:hypothetical protein
MYIQMPVAGINMISKAPVWYSTKNIGFLYLIEPNLHNIGISTEIGALNF